MRIKPRVQDRVSDGLNKEAVDLAAQIARNFEGLGA